MRKQESLRSNIEQIIVKYDVDARAAFKAAREIVHSIGIDPEIVLEYLRVEKDLLGKDNVDLAYRLAKMDVITYKKRSQNDNTSPFCGGHTSTKREAAVRQG